jgi:hypothetical protein
VGGTDGGAGTAALGDALTTAAHADVEVHTVNSDSGIVLDTEIDVLADTEAEVTGLGEVALAELVLLDLEATLEDLLGLGATDGDVNGDLLVTTDTEGTDGVAGLACCDFVSCDSRIGGLDPLKSKFQGKEVERTVNRGLTRKLLEHLCGTSKSVTRLSNGDVEDELLDTKILHGVLGLFGLSY